MIQSSKGFSFKTLHALCAGLCLASFGCADDGASPVCPELPLYDVTNPASKTKELEQQRLEAVRQGCLTAIGAAGKGTAGSGSAGSGAAGSGAAGSDSGR